MHVNYADELDYEMLSLTSVYAKYLVNIREFGCQLFPLRRSDMNIGKRLRIS
jgi:hypothetical protein